MEMVISRKYEVLGQLGQGGMGVVYKVRHVALDTILALKVLPRELMANPEMVSRFYREARVMARLRHPNIIRVLDIERDDALDFYYFVMEYIEGKTLRQYVQEQGPLPLADVLTIATQVARALMYAHAHTPPIVHRDIKPANIMIEDGSSRVVVMDFGVAKELGDGEMTKSGVVLGTLKYCSPEQLRHEPLDGSADVYALGMVMYEAYTGTQFFAGLDEAGVIGKVLYESADNEPRFSQPTPPAFTALVKKAIAKSRERRYRRMDELLHDIEACFASLGDNKTIVMPAPRKEEPPPEHSEIEDLNEQIRRLEGERQRRLATAARAQAQDAREKATAAGAGRLAAALLQQGAVKEELGHARMQGNQYPAALDAYREAVELFTKANEEASVAALLDMANHARQEMQTAKAEAERAGARDKARTFYRRALALQAQADEQWESHAYQQAAALYAEACAFFTDAQELASREALKAEADAARMQMTAAKERALRTEAEEQAPSLFLAALEQERRADTAVQQEEFSHGRELYTAAQRAYERATQEVISLRRQRETARAKQSDTMAHTPVPADADDDSASLWTVTPDLHSPAETGSRPLDPEAGGSGAGEDRWEIGEKAAESETDSVSPTPPQPPRRTPLILGVLAVLVMVGWFSFSLLRPQPTPPSQISPPPPVQSVPSPPPLPPQAPPALTLTQAEPQEETVKVTAGEELVFAARVSGADPLYYEWTLDGKPVAQQRQWTYRPNVGEGGGEPKTVRLTVLDQYGQHIEKTWRVTVAAANQPPRVITATPAKDTVELASGASQTFSLDAQDPENGKLAYEWTLDGKTMSAQPTFTWKAQGDGKHRVRVVVRDQAGLAASQEWQVAVVTPPQAPPAPKNAPPRIAQRLPADRAVSVKEGDHVDFSALGLDPDNEEVFYSWSVDGKRVAQGDRFSYPAEAAGKHRVDLEVSDKGGLKDTFRWEVQVEIPPAAPRIAMYTPHREKMQLYAHLSRFFGVEVIVPGMVEPPIRYEWKIDGRPVRGQELLEFRNQKPGLHEVEVTATGPSGASVARRWIVEVKERRESDEPGPAGPPYLEMVEFDNNLSPDKKSVIVKGGIRNADDREVENVIIWVSALDAQQETIARRLALPAPQPLAPGQTASFQIAFDNKKEISNFKVEIVSK